MTSKPMIRGAKHPAHPSALALIAGIMAAIMAPPADISPAEWMEQNFILPDGPYEGQRYSFDDTPYLRPIADALRISDPATEIAVRKSAQTGVTTLGLGWISFVVAEAPTQMLVVQPTGDARKNFIEEKLDPALQASKATRNKVATIKSRSNAGSTAKRKRFPGGWLALASASSASDLRMRTVRYSFCDEVTQWPLNLDQQGDPLSMVDARHLAYHATGDYKSLRIGTPGIEGICRIDAEYQRGTQENWQVPCPDCGAYQKLTFANLRYSETWPHKAEYQCAECGVLIPHHKKRGMVAAGRMVADNPAANRRSFHIDALISNVTTWDKMVEAYLEAGQNQELLKAFYNLWLGLPFEVQGEAPDAELLHKRSLISDYQIGELPYGVLFLTAGVDVQKDRLEVEIDGWGVLMKRWKIGHFVLPGDPNLMDVWFALDELRKRKFTDARGITVSIGMMAIDSRYCSQAVYRYCVGKGNVIAVKGAKEDAADHPILGTPRDAVVKKSATSPKSHRVRWYPVGTWQCKMQLYSALHLEGPDEQGEYPPGYVFFPQGLDQAYFEQLTAEVMQLEPQKYGPAKARWQRLPGRAAEVLDGSVYSYAAAAQLGMQSWSPAQWQQLARDRLGSGRVAEMDLLDRMMSPLSASAQAAKSDNQAGKRRVIPRGTRRL